MITFNDKRMGLWSRCAHQGVRIFMNTVLLLTLFQFNSSSTLQSLVFTTEPSDKLVTLGSSTSLHCKVHSTFVNSVVVILWKHNETWITDYSQKHFTLLANGTLTFPHLLDSDQGSYQCAALVYTNNVKVVQRLSRNATVTVPFIGNKFLHISPTINQVLGSTIHLQCVTPQSIPSAIVYWEKDDRRLHSYVNDSQKIDYRTSATLKIINISFKDTGSYKCCAVNPMIPSKIIRSQDIHLTIKANQPEPYFVVKPVATMATRYQKAVLHCKIMGDPLPSITWFKSTLKLFNNTDHVIAFNGSLLFKQIKQSTAGHYSCMGSNTHGFIQSDTVPLVVAYIDYDFITNPQNVIVVASQPLLLNCQPPLSYPLTLQVSWYRNHKLIAFDHGYHKYLNNSLRIDHVVEGDSGEYYCEVFNSFTKEVRTSKKAKVIVNVPPTVHVHTTFIHIPLGHLLNIECNAFGIPSPNITIHKIDMQRNTSILLSLNGSYIIQSVTANSTGFYRCFAINKAGYDMKQINVTVLTPPAASIQPKNQTVVSGSSARFHCLYLSVPAPQISWLFTSGNVSINITVVTSEFNLLADGLMIKHVSKRHQGWYTCHAMNIIGHKSSSAFLHILEPPSVRTSYPYVITNLTDNVQLKCIITGDPLPIVKWWKSNTLITYGERYKLSQAVSYVDNLYHIESILQVQSVSSFDSGVYQCISDNSLSLSALGNITLVVHVPPSIKSFALQSSLLMGSDLKVTCTSFGIPSPKLLLKHNGTLIYSESNPIAPTVVLSQQYQQISSLYSGHYECIAVNYIGMEIEAKNITIKVSPNAPIIADVVVLSPFTINITWSLDFDGYSSIESYSLQMKPINQRWQIVSASLPPRPLYYLISNLSPYTLYAFRMSAQNEVGESALSDVKEEKTTEAAPSAPVYLGSTKTSTSLLLHWKHPLFPNGIVKFFQISYQHVVEEIIQVASGHGLVDHYHNMTSLKPYTLYKIKIRAATIPSNVTKWGNYSKIVSIITDESIPIGVVSSVNVANVTNTSLLISFQPPNTDLINGRLVGYLIRYIENSNEEFLSVQSTSVTLYDLQPYTSYSISVAVVNGVGSGQFSSAINLTMMTGVPGSIDKIKVKQLNEDSVTISWAPPHQKNGLILLYEVKILNNKADLYLLLRSNITEVSTKNLSSNQTYTISVRAITSAGNGPYGVGIKHSLVPVISTTKPTELTKIPVASQSWLEREYLIVVISLSAFAFFTILVFLVVLLSRQSCFYRKKKDAGNDWQMNPYYDNHTVDDDENMYSKNLLYSKTDTMKYRDFREDFIWDDDSIDEVVTKNLSTEPNYELPKTPSTRYASVEPYQGQRVNSSPFVKLKGIPKKSQRGHDQNEINNISTDQPTQTQQNGLYGNKNPDEISISNLDLIDALIENELNVVGDIRRTSYVM